ncbi:MAG: hypothetical protein HZC40_02695 [Chloroflexi bacterium]|nr:hypothetical protein [Chloroflexota bacterium]
MNITRIENPSLWRITLTFARAISLTDEDLAVELVNDDIQHNTNLSRIILHEVIRFQKHLQIFIEGLDSDARDIAQTLTANLFCKATLVQHSAR